MKYMGFIGALLFSTLGSSAPTPIPLSAQLTEKNFLRARFELKVNESCADRMKCFITRDKALRVDVSQTRNEVYVCYDCRHQPPFLMYRQKISQHIAEVLRGNHEMLDNQYAKSCSMRIGFRKNNETYGMSIENLAANPRGCREIRKQRD